MRKSSLREKSALKKRGQFITISSVPNLDSERMNSLDLVGFSNSLSAISPMQYNTIFEMDGSRKIGLDNDVLQSLTHDHVADEERERRQTTTTDNNVWAEDLTSMEGNDIEL